MPSASWVAPQRSSLWPANRFCSPNGTTPTPGLLISMSKTTKALKKQAATSQRVAQRAANPFLAREMSTLAEAFRAQAAVLKRKKKKKK